MSGVWLLGLLCLAVLFIIVSTHRYKLHPFFALIIVAYVIGLSGGLSIEQTLSALTTGFGDTLGSIGIIIAAGAVIGSLLKGSGGTYVIANVIVDLVGKARSAIAMSITASIVAPLLAKLGLVEGFRPALVTLAIGAGAMTVSHVNDSYFWVVSEFSGMDVTQAYKLQTLGSAVAGITGIIVIYIINLGLN